MKQDISIPNPIFQAAEDLAKKMGVSLSELYTAALNAYVAEHQKENITETLDQIYANEPSTLEPELLKMQVVSLEGEEW
jgi:metal-responsive CopG/Arc/MetJ family transcriptional regulator